MNTKKVRITSNKVEKSTAKKERTSFAVLSFLCGLNNHQA
jgi:hypothetical protein